MANPAAIAEGGVGLKLPLLVDGTGAPMIPAAGDDEAIGSYTNHRAPALVQQVKSTAAIRSNVSAASSDTLLLAANDYRKGATIYNDSEANSLYIGLGTTAVTASSFTVIVPPGGYWEMPFFFKGQLRGMWDTIAGTPPVLAGTARVTEFS